LKCVHKFHHEQQAISHNLTITSQRNHLKEKFDITKWEQSTDDKNIYHNEQQITNLTLTVSTEAGTARIVRGMYETALDLPTSK